MVAIAVMIVLSVFFICIAASDYAKYKYGNTSENNCEMCPYRKECEETLIKVEPDSFCETKTYKIENIGQGKFFIYGEPKRLTRKECLEQAKSEAIKEFAERLKTKCAFDRGFAVMPDDAIDNLVKEMTEVNENGEV